MSTTFTIDSSTSRATPVSAPMKRVTVPAVRKRKGGEPLVMLTAYTVRTAQLFDPHCDLLLVGDSLGQVIYGLPSTVPVSLEMMAAHGAAVVRGSYHAMVVVDMPFGSYETSPEKAFESAAWLLKQTGAAGVKLEGGVAMAPTVQFLVERGIPVMGHVGLTPQAVNMLGGYGARGRTQEEAAKIIDDGQAIARAGAFSLVVEGVIEPIAIELTRSIDCPTIGIGASAQCDGQVLVAEDMLGMFERVPRFVKRYGDMAGYISERAEAYANEVRSRAFPGVEQVYQPK
ncbi:MAG: 3-methyl-2-oxobutanoate hydroxymethyltransferase [Sphingomonas sp.]|uniref:3-methyl-2-oxobutanoate hydroxymethyltransferase n=1 Tax=Sphingomonas lycopersici TaxID=2951807 RepID=A0AA41ZAC7_9SPHN|nr:MULTISPECIES: 3-methyl-2-oxobutanoate hydroxymethyltransferase [Sphingomonas]MBV8238088.1 3-methyl-2-oxobutanoate hydroxymethyltransferase [Sphingomonas sp.]MCW6535913.1 3-methyl-2-oxobutanoate hydroxymethyltransferase [Sphingomonas lycopersici]OJU15366.1 MAG: 3-methyl-2-oxobutanoate hydroxymethyltransferase [Sphingomonas sp. 66-10]